MGGLVIEFLVIVAIVRRGNLAVFDFLLDPSSRDVLFSYAEPNALDA